MMMARRRSSATLPPATAAATADEPAFSWHGRPLHHGILASSPVTLEVILRVSGPGGLFFC